MQTSYDIVLFGATSFVGQITAQQLLKRHGAHGDGPEGLRWAMAGRSKEKLEATRVDLGSDAEDLALIVADAHDEASLDDLVAQTRGVVSTVGPYTRHGSLLVEICARTGTDYCDLTGEVQWIRRMIDQHHDAAVSSGARLVPSAGFDSIPSDLGMWFLQRAFAEKFGEPASRVRFALKNARGGFSGGTVASMMAVAEELRDADLRRQIASPYALCPRALRSGVRQPNVTRPAHDDDFGAWTAPFLMAGINTRVVHRSNALLGHAWGTDLRYDEVMLTGTGALGLAKATGITAALGGVLAGASFGPTRTLLNKVFPGTGEGPSPTDQEKGYFTVLLRGESDAGQLVVRVHADKDPGYGATGRMLAEVAASLASDDVAQGGGFWTTASLLAEPLLDRLTEHAGMSFSIVG